MILDGAVGTELWGRGIDTAGALWSANAIDRAPEVLASIHRDYAAAGATVHTAATFRTKRRSAGESWERLARRAVAIAREAVPEGHRIAGSIAPLEDCYRPDQAPTDSSLLVREHGELARALVDAGVDLLLAETFAAPHEAVAATEACVATGVETWVALTAGPRADLLTPAALAEAARRCVDAGARAVLVNCVPATKTLAYVEALARVGAPFGAYANAGDMEEGLGWVAANEARGPAVRYAELARTWASAGATILGGCCGTGPTHIEALAQMLSVRAPPTSAPRAGE
ncbi:MAG: homocysteine S-methyltransferase family protein [Polyangiaceae bacterium]